MFNRKALRLNNFFAQPRRFILFNMRKEEQNLYTMLKVKTSASHKEIKLAYYKQAKISHPDFLVGATDDEKAAAAEDFKKINKAYEVLCNAISRQAYDIENHIN
jgi:DnaJ-class molecular chaperone